MGSAIKQKHLSYLKKTYPAFESAVYEDFGIIDTYMTIDKKINNNNFITKGAFNLFTKFNYCRSDENNDFSLTSDIDYSICNISLKQAELFLSELLNNLDSDFYEIKSIKISQLPIAPKNTGGLRIEFKSFLKGVNTNFPCQVDIAYEDIPDSELILKDEKGRKFYSIERTLADKYSACIEKGIKNDRGKDYIDILYLFPRITNKELFFETIKVLLYDRQLDVQKVKEWKYSWKTFVSVLSNKLKFDSKVIDIIDEINKNVLADLHKYIKLDFEVE